MNCTICGGEQHLDCDEMVTRCDVVPIERFGTVHLMELYCPEGTA